MDDWVRYLVCFILGWLAARMMGDGFSVGGPLLKSGELCNDDTDCEGCCWAKYDQRQRRCYNKRHDNCKGTCKPKTKLPAAVTICKYANDIDETFQKWGGPNDCNAINHDNINLCKWEYKEKRKKESTKEQVKVQTEEQKKYCKKKFPDDPDYCKNCQLLHKFFALYQDQATVYFFQNLF